MQKNWIGKATGCELKFQIFQHQEGVTVFTTRPDTIFGASFLAISVDHPLCKKLELENDFLEFKEECLKTGTTVAALANAEKKEINIINAYMPKMLTADEVEKVIDDTILDIEAKSLRDLGKVISKIKKDYSGRCDFADVSQMIRERLEG